MDVDINYLADFFDGEGSLGIYRGGSGGGHTLRVQLTQTATPAATAMFAALRERWGGSVSEYNKSLRRPAINWQVSGQSAVALLKAMRPHLILKAAQADVAIDWMESRPARRRNALGHIEPWTAEEVAFHEATARRLVELKRDGLEVVA